MTRQVKLLSSTEVAKIMGVGQSTVGNWFMPDTNQPPPAGMPEPVRIGRSWRWQERTIRTWVRDEWPQHPRHAQIKAHRKQIQPRKRAKPVEMPSQPESAQDRAFRQLINFPEVPEMKLMPADELPNAVSYFLDTVAKYKGSAVMLEMALQLGARGK